MARPRKGKSVSVDEVSKRLDPDSIVVGTKLSYLGDQKPWASPFLRSKGDKAGAHLLPVFEDVGGSKNWIDVPGSKTAEYHIVSIETGRRRKPSKAHPEGKPMEDLIIIKSSEYAMHLIALVPDDVREKFKATWVPSVYDDPSISEDEAKEAERAASSWSEEVSQDGW